MLPVLGWIYEFVNSKSAATMIYSVLSSMFVLVMSIPLLYTAVGTTRKYLLLELREAFQICDLSFHQ